MIGTTVGKYRIVDRLGRGGMGIVYKAVDETLERDVAIKVLNPDLSDTEVLKRFRAEAVTLARLNHHGIATLYELHRHDDELLMVMEYVRGETFHDLSDRIGPLAPSQAAHLCVQVLDALAHAHRAGVVHRDLKPANLMVTENGSVKVMDFGIARVLGTERQTQSGYMMGTPAYMSPEQVLEREVDGRADLYALGVVLYRLLAAHLPFEADTAIAMMQKQLSDPPTPVAVFRTDLPEWWSGIIDRALAKDPADRFQTAEEFRFALLDAKPEPLSELPTTATPAPPGLLRAPDMTVTRDTRWPGNAASVRRRQMGSAAVSTPPVQPTASKAPAATTPRPAETPSSVERTTATTVVLGRTHLVGIGALLVVFAVGIGVLGFAALRRSGIQQQLVGTQPQSSSEATSTTPAPEPETSRATTPADVSPPPAATGGSTVPATAGGGSTQPAGLPSAQGPARAAQRAAATSSTDPAIAKAAAATPDNVSAPPAPPVKAVAPPFLSFEGVRVLVADGADKSREREGVLQLGGGQLTIVERAGGASIAILSYESIAATFYSRSRQPRWHDADGKVVEKRVDLGRMGFFRGERNWLIFLSNGEPLIVRLDDKDLKTMLPAVQEQTGVPIKR